MADEQNYTSLQEFTEDMSPRGNKPILYTAQGKQGINGVKLGANCMNKPTILLLTALLVSLTTNIVLGVLLYKASTISSTCSQLTAVKGAPAMRRLDTLQSRYNQLCQDYITLGQNCTQPGVKVSECRPCPDSWLHFEDKCYYFSSDKMDWEKSKESCEAMGSHLAILHSHAQHEALEKAARSKGTFDYHYWIGLTDRHTEGEWKWVDNTPVNNTYWDKVHSEPDNHLSGGEEGEDCATLNSHSRSWFDVPCNFIYLRICEMEAMEVN
ncbi:hypothetical protein AGOR_G00207230 [Albula goreensis]|uniref:C-type lectin domain-containing protein n=1 Tax=Albula goreensis TaxID=1534307 RepID=A0A8T3CP42_9TELE|nr:hypothetical protein AGOR_G00207230 [Albula goreensis]